jgi:CBS domain containing-hemolysin-like protein
MDHGLHLIFLVILFGLAAFFAATETALFSLTRIERRRLEERYPRLGKLITDLLNHPRRTLVTLLIGNNVVQILATAIVTLVALRFFGAEGVAIVIVLFTVLLIFVGEIVPKIFAVRNNESVALATAPILEVVSALLWPLRRLVELASDKVLSFILRDTKEASTSMSAQELKLLVKIGEEEGILDRNERRMIQKLFELGERPVRSIMTPRTDVAALRVGDPWDKTLQTIREFSFSYFPVYQESLDQILGVVTTQEVVLSEEKNLEKWVRPAPFVPELKRIDELLRDFQKTGDRFAVLVDEFGGTAGVVTLEDIFEEIFGEYHDEYARLEESIRELGGGEYLVDAKVSLTPFNEFFHSDLHAREAETLSGFLLEKMGRVPRKGDVLDLKAFHFRIHDMARQRILKVVVRPKR